MTTPNHADAVQAILTDLRAAVSLGRAITGAELDELEAALSQPAASGEVVEGAVYHDGGVSLVRRGSEDEWCRERGAQRIYRNTSPQPDADTVRDAELWRLCTGTHRITEGEEIRCHINVGVNVWQGEDWCAFYECNPEELRAAIDSAIKGEKS